MKLATIIVSLCLVFGSAWGAGTYFPHLPAPGQCSAHQCLLNMTVADIFFELQQIFELAQLREAQSLVLIESLSIQNSEFSSILKEQFSKSETFTSTYESFVSSITEKISTLETSFVAIQQSFSSFESRIETISSQVTSIISTSTSTNTETSSSTFTSESFSQQLLLIQQQVQQMQQVQEQIVEQQASSTAVAAAEPETSGVGYHFVLQENTKVFDRLAKSGGLVELDGEYFYFRNDPLLSWNHASAICREIGMRMLTLEKKDKTEKIFEYIKTNTRFTEKHFWLGAIRITKQDGSYIYLWEGIARPVRENSWEEGQPDEEPNAECVDIRGDGENLAWHNTDCESKNGVICEMIVTP